IVRTSMRADPGILANGPRNNVRFGSKADMCNAPTHVRFTPNSDIDCVFGLSTREPALAGQGTDFFEKPTSPILLRNCKAWRSRCSSTRFCIGCARSQNCRLGGARCGQEFVAGLFPRAKCVAFGC